MAMTADNENWLDDEKVQAKVRAMKHPPFDFEIPDHLEESINGLIKCLEDKDRYSLDLWESDVHSCSRDAKTEEQMMWIMNYYANEGWLDD